MALVSAMLGPLMRIEILNRPVLKDGRAAKVKKTFVHLLPGVIQEVRLVDVYCIPEIYSIDAETAKALFCDTVAQDIFLDGPVFSAMQEIADTFIEIAFKPGVTDPVGITATEALKLECSLNDIDLPLVQSAKQYQIFTNRELLGEERSMLGKALFNPLIQRADIRSHEDINAGYRFPAIYKGVHVTDFVEPKLFDIVNASDDLLVKISKDRLLALTLSEMKVIQAYFSDPEIQSERVKAGLTPQATDIELEMMGQTWSEHCKHKIFAADVHYEDPEAGKKQIINGLFKTYIRNTTQILSEENVGLRSVFHDNAGVVDFDNDHVVCFKVETHNSPSALDPYGGAITGIVGVNRDILGTGIGAKPIFNTNVLCFADPETPAKDVPVGLLHPKRIMRGVHEGIIDGGNQSGIPTVAGGFIFDESYIGKPLVYCGTGGIMPRMINGRESWTKQIDAGDLAVMVGGRIGKDGIHGATFSSLALDEDSPSSAVQIGDPITQRKVWDFLLEARDRGLYKGITDNGAGGISSSLGEMAQYSGGVQVEIDKCPLKYPGLSAWEIWVSESQERMSLAVDPSKQVEFLALAHQRAVEATVIGTFTNSGYIDLKYKETRVGYLKMKFVHDGLPTMSIPAKWIPSKVRRAGIKLSELSNFNKVDFLRKYWLDALGHVNVRSREELVRQYDHEVQGNTIVKPYQGKQADSPTDGSVIRPVRNSFRGLSVTHGICPRVGDDDTYKMTLCAVDEAYRSHIALGGTPDSAYLLDNFCWPDPVESEETPDGAYKMAQLVRSNMALQEACLAYKLPLISGKDSMKNDARLGGKKISVRPTLLISLMGIIPDTRLTPGTGFSKSGDLIFLVGETRTELSGSIIEHLLQLEQNSNLPHLGSAPTVQLNAARKLYIAFSQAIQHGLVRSVHDLSDGGLLVALAEAGFHNRLGCNLDLSPILESIIQQDEKHAAPALTALFAETPSRYLVSISPDHEKEFRQVMQGNLITFLGFVRDDGHFSLSWNAQGNHHLTVSMDEALAAWKKSWQE